MKNHHFMVLAFLAILAASCHDSPIGDSFADDLYVPIGALVSASNVQTGFYDLGDPDNSSIAFDIDAESEGEALTTLDVVISYNGGPHMPFKSSVSLGETISATFNEAMAAAGVAVGDVAIDDSFRFLFKTTSSSGTFISSNSININVSCKSELAGVLDYVSSNNFCSSADLTGQVTLSEVNAGEYAFDDWSFGTYQACYSQDFTSAGSLLMKDVCNKISVSGQDSYGDTWELTIKEVNGPDLSVYFINTFGEFSDVILTRTDGKDWPPLSN